MVAKMTAVKMTAAKIVTEDEKLAKRKRTSFVQKAETAGRNQQHNILPRSQNGVPCFWLKNETVSFSTK